GVEPDPLELGDVAFQLALEPLCPGPDARELRRPARRACFAGGLAGAAVMTTQTPVAVQCERDMAVRAAGGGPAGAAMERGRDAAPVEHEDRLAAFLRHPAQLGQQRR